MDLDLNLIFTFIRNNGRNLNARVENNARNFDKAALTGVLNALKKIRENNIQNMTESGVDPEDFPDEQISIAGYSIEELIDHVEELILMAPPSLSRASSEGAGGGKRKSRRQRKTRKNFSF